MIGDVTTVRGGEYFFAPGLRALRWLADGEHGAGQPRGAYAEVRDG